MIVTKVYTDKKYHPYDIGIIGYLDENANYIDEVVHPDIPPNGTDCIGCAENCYVSYVDARMHPNHVHYSGIDFDTRHSFVPASVGHIEKTDFGVYVYRSTPQGDVFWGCVKSDGTIWVYVHGIPREHCAFSEGYLECGFASGPGKYLAGAAYLLLTEHWKSCLKDGCKISYNGYEMPYNASPHQPSDDASAVWFIIIIFVVLFLVIFW